jgi:hypothetical protein
MGPRPGGSLSWGLADLQHRKAERGAGGAGKESVGLRVFPLIGLADATTLREPFASFSRILATSAQMSERGGRGVLRGGESVTGSGRDRYLRCLARLVEG